MTDTDWLKKKPGNPMRLNLRRSTNRFYAPSPDMNASLMTTEKHVLNELPPMRARINIKPIGITGMLKKNYVSKSPKGIPNSRATLRPSQFSAPRARQSTVVPMYKSTQAVRSTQMRQTTFLGSRKSLFIPSVRSAAPVFKPPPKPAQAKAPSTPQVHLSPPPVLRSILKQSQEKVSRLPVARTGREELQTRKPPPKPKAAKKVNFDGGQGKENALNAVEAACHVKPLETLTEVTAGGADEAIDLSARSTKNDESSFEMSQLEVSPPNKPSVELSSVSEGHRSEFLQVCAAYRTKMDSLWEQFMTEVSTKFGIDKAGVGETIKQEASTVTDPVRLDTNPSPIHPLDPPVEMRRSTRDVRSPKKFMFEGSPIPNVLRKVADKSKAIRKKKERQPKKSPSRKEAQKSKAYKVLQKSMNLDSDEDSDEMENSPGNTPLNTPARRRQMSKRVKLQLSRIIDS